MVYAKCAILGYMQIHTIYFVTLSLISTPIFDKQVCILQ